MLEKRNRIIIFGTILIIFLGLLSYGVVFALNFPDNYPEETLLLEERVSDLLASITLPIKTAKLSRREPEAQIFIPVYGARVAQITDTWQAPRAEERTHDGQDIFASKGTPVFSATYGYITRIGTSNLGGNYVFITGAGGRRYYYAHLDRFADKLKVGQEVTTDTVIGYVGNTGNAQSTPPHLHFGVYESRRPVNPLPLLINRI